MARLLALILILLFAGRTYGYDAFLDGPSGSQAGLNTLYKGYLLDATPADDSNNSFALKMINLGKTSAGHMFGMGVYYRTNPRKKKKMVWLRGGDPESIHILYIVCEPYDEEAATYSMVLSGSTMELRMSAPGEGSIPCYYHCNAIPNVGRIDDLKEVKNALAAKGAFRRLKDYEKVIKFVKKEIDKNEAWSGKARSTVSPFSVVIRKKRADDPVDVPTAKIRLIKRNSISSIYSYILKFKNSASVPVEASARLIMKDKDGFKVDSTLTGIGEVPPHGVLEVTDDWWIDLEDDDPSNTVEIVVETYRKMSGR